MKNILFDEIIKNLEFMRKHLYEVDNVESYLHHCRASEYITRSLHEDLKDLEYYIAYGMTRIYTDLISLINNTGSVVMCV